MSPPTAESAAAVLHITAAAGGGADRYIRDLAESTRRQHHVLHVGAGPTVVERIGAGRFTALANFGNADVDVGALRRWLELAGIGILHVHGVDEACRTHVDALLRARALPYVVTLHDLQFVNPRAFDASGMPEPEADWIVAMSPMLERAATVIVPSEFILDVALACSAGIQATVIPPGVRAGARGAVPEAPQDFAARAPKHVVAIVGALGPHKGSGVLLPLAAALDASDIGIVVIGYTDTQVTRGWLVPGIVYVHGAYEDGTLAAWLAAYRAETVLFPNRLPESFSYTLSEVWSAGVPVVVPDQGALGERVDREGGGWLLPAGFDGDEAAALLVWLSSTEGDAERARVKSRIQPGDVRRIPTLEAMSRDVDALYARFGLPPSDSVDAGAANDALAPLLATSLDGFAFRKELVKLANELGEARRGLRRRGVEREARARRERVGGEARSRHCRAQGRDRTARRGKPRPRRAQRRVRSAAAGHPKVPSQASPTCADLMSASSRSARTCRFLKRSSRASPSRRRAQNVSVLILDNTPDAETTTRIAALPLLQPGGDFARTDVRHSPTNVGFGRGHNANAGRCTAPFLFVLNQDCILEPGCSRRSSMSRATTSAAWPRGSCGKYRTSTRRRTTPSRWTCLG